MPKEFFNEPENQPQGQPEPELQNQPEPEPQPELDPFERVLQELPEDKRKIVEEGYMRNKDYTQKTQKFSEERKRYEQQMRENQTKIDFYNRFRDDDNFRGEVLSSLGATKKVQKSDDFEEQYAKAQELMNELDPNARKAMQFLIKKQIRDELTPFKEKVSNFERQQAESQQKKLQQAQAERQKVFQKFVKEHPDFDSEVESKMSAKIARFPGFYNQSPADFGAALEDVYDLVVLPKQKQKEKEKGIKQMLDQNARAQAAASKAAPRPSPSKVYTNQKKGMSLKECADETWEKMGMGG